MSSLFSRPKMPSMPTAQYLPLRSDTTDKETKNDPADSDDTRAADEERVNQILFRNRGRTGTIGTSFRGILNDPSSAQNLPTRKTLLGE